MLSNINRAGTLPHVTPDLVNRYSSLNSVYAALEDCKIPLVDAGMRKLTEVHDIIVIEQVEPPLLDVSDISTEESKLKKFISLPDDHLLVLNARRSPPIFAPSANTNDSIVLSTSVGFQNLDIVKYSDIVSQIQPDIVVGLADIQHGVKPGVKRLEKMCSRTEKWLRVITQICEPSENSKVAIFAPLLPVSQELQRGYLDFLVDEMTEKISGLVCYEAFDTSKLPQELQCLPRLALSEPSSPLQILREVALGIDIFTVPFVTAATDAGIALDFRLSKTLSSLEYTSPRVLGLDLWQDVYKMDLTPLATECGCYTCKTHHKAYVQHLLSAKEMLAWTLLQIHNHQIIEMFFNDIRLSIEGGTLEDEIDCFVRTYEHDLPAKTGKGPRYVRTMSQTRKNIVNTFQGSGDISSSPTDQGTRNVMRQLSKTSSDHQV